MVDVMDAYSILNKSVLNVLNDLVILDSYDFEDKPVQIRLEESAVPISEVHSRLDNGVVVAHNLNHYVNRFYSIFLDSSEVVLLDYLINVNPETIDLTEFGEFT